jgi:hypothetical protein
MTKDYIHQELRLEPALASGMSIDLSKAPAATLTDTVPVSSDKVTSWGRGYMPR